MGVFAVMTVAPSPSSSETARDHIIAKMRSPAGNWDSIGLSRAERELIVACLRSGDVAQDVPEPVAFQYRFQDDTGEWNGWFICDKHQYDRVTRNGKIGYCKAETRLLYASPVSSTDRATTDRNLAESRCEDCPAPRCIVCPVTSTDRGAP